MFLSDEQTAAATHGLSRQKLTFDWVDVPVGPQPLPDWARGLEVRWLDGYVGRPGYTLVVRPDFQARDWPGKVFCKYGHRYLAESGDGRAECYYHSGEPTYQELRRRKWSMVLCGPYEGELRPYPHVLDRGKYYWSETYMAWATYQDEGFGGATTWVRLDDGRDVALRGPWHGRSPPGYVDVGTSRCGCVYLAEDLLVLLLARHQPHCRVARLTRGTESWVEAVRPDWDVPKSVGEDRR